MHRYHPAPAALPDHDQWSVLTGCVNRAYAAAHSNARPRVLVELGLSGIAIARSDLSFCNQHAGAVSLSAATLSCECRANLLATAQTCAGEATPLVRVSAWAQSSGYHGRASTYLSRQGIVWRFLRGWEALRVSPAGMVSCKKRGGRAIDDRTSPRRESTGALFDCGEPLRHSATRVKCFDAVSRSNIISSHVKAKGRLPERLLHVSPSSAWEALLCRRCGETRCQIHRYLRALAPLDTAASSPAISFGWGKLNIGIR